MHNPDPPHYLVPTNFGAASRMARRLALDWAAGTGARVTLLHVRPAPIATVSDLDAEGLRHLGNRLAVGTDPPCKDLAQIERELHPELKELVDLRTAWRQGDLIGEIVEFILEQAIDVVLVGARRWRLPWRTLLGQELARRTACQVVLVHEPAARALRRAASAGYANRLLRACGIRRRSAAPAPAARDRDNPREPIS